MPVNIPERAQNDYWSETIETILNRLETSIQGLNGNESARRLEYVGKNTLDTRAEMTPLRLFWAQFQSPIVLILLFATAVSAFVQDWMDAITILAIVLGSAVLSFAQEFSATNAVAKLKARVNVKTRILRNGQETTIAIEEVVPGDVVLLSAGALIPADGVLIEAKDLFVDQAALTGETFPVEKRPGVVAADTPLSARTNCVLMGTSVRSGSGKALIVQTGDRTAFGQIAKRLTLRPSETEFEHGIRKLGYLLTEVMLVMVMAIFALNVLFQKPVLDSLLFSIALAVGLTPQLLPAVIKVTLAKGSQKMAQHGVIVRRLVSIENFGSMDILCTDKTGTITAGVVRLDYSCDAHGEDSPSVRRAAWLNAHFQSGIANPLDEAILASVQESVDAVIKIDEIPYDFTRKRLSVVVEEDGCRRLICKGALEMVLEVCTQIAIADRGQTVLDEKEMQEIHARYATWSAQGYRVLSVAQKPVSSKESYTKDDERELILLGFILFLDPPKPDVKNTLERLKTMGVSVKIITGDNRLVARHTAEAIGIPAPVILTGAEIEHLSDESLWISAERTDIFAEVDPNEKERIILALKKMGHVVGYLGDGINDAPALHSADVGVSVENAVDVAREAADFVLLEQDLNVLADGIIEGRKTFANTLKYVFMAVSANFGNMFSVAGASLFLPYLPLLPKQILLMNFLTDLPEMTIAGDNVDEVYVQKAHRWDIGFIRRFMLIFGPLSSVFDYATFVVLLWWLKLPEASFQTGWFLESVFSAALVVFVVRTRLPFLQGKPSHALLIATFVTLAAALALPYSPFAPILAFTSLPIQTLFFLSGIIILYFIAAELLKHWFYQQLRENR